MFLLGRLDSLILTGFCFLWMGCLGVGGRLVDSVAIPASEVPSFEQVLMRVTRIKRKNIPLIVYLDGTYTIESKRDLGKEYSDITFRPAPNAKHPVLTGMHKITNWDQIDGIWKTQLPKFVNSFFVDGRRLPKAKMPLVGNYTVEGQYSLEDNSKFCYKGQDINPNWIGAEIVTVQAWAESRMTIKEVDPTMRTVVLSGKMKPYNIISNPPYWVENLVEGLEVPGTWAIDKNNILSYRPRLGEEPLKTECSVPLTEQFFNIHNLSNLSFEKINFIGSDWLLPPTGYANLQADADLCGTIQMEYVNHCSFIECEFAHLGSHAIWCDNGCNQNVFRNNSMEDLGGGGIVVGYNNKLPGIHDISTNNIK